MWEIDLFMYTTRRVEARCNSALHAPRIRRNTGLGCIMQCDLSCGTFPHTAERPDRPYRLALRGSLTLPATELRSTLFRLHSILVSYLTVIPSTPDRPSAAANSPPGLRLSRRQFGLLRPVSLGVSACGGAQESACRPSDCRVLDPVEYLFLECGVFLRTPPRLQKTKRNLSQGDRLEVENLDDMCEGYGRRTVVLDRTHARVFSLPP